MAYSVIHNDEQLRLAYGLLKRIENDERYKNWAVDIKKSIRSYNNRMRIMLENMVWERSIADRNDWETIHIVSRYERMTDEEKQEYKDGNWIRIYSPYDCTGQWFTMFMHFVDIGDMTVIIETRGLDV